MEGTKGLDLENIYIDDDDEFKNLKDSSASWASIVEEELGDSLHDKPLTGSLHKSKSFEEEDEEKKVVTVDDILKSNHNDLNELLILEYQTIISTNLKKIIKTDIEEKNINNFDFSSIIKKLEWLKLGSMILNNKLGLELCKHKFNNNNVIPRSSYKFCNYTYDCEFNYDFKKHRGCYAQHFVHNLVYADIDILLKFIQFKENKNLEIKDLDEFLKSVNTISFVINHMYDEIKNSNPDHVNGDRILHVERTPKKKRNNKRKKIKVKGKR